MAEKLFIENHNDTLLSNIGISSEFDLKKIKWARIREGKQKEKTKAHIALEKSIYSPIVKPKDELG